jgi:sugar O-acyltransferase (sialic acid O-acetyltransferase NeuD family)
MKNLVYYSISNQTVYAEMLKLSIQTIDESNDDFIDILVITDELFYQNNLSDIKRPNLFFHFVEQPISNDHICFNKYCIFDWELVDKYEKILYLDCDILVSYDLTKLFNKCNFLDKLHVVVEDYSIKNHNRIQFGFGDYDDKQIQSFSTNSIYTFNAGSFLFLNTQFIKQHFHNLRELIRKGVENYFTDQSFVNYYFNTLNAVNYEGYRKEVDLVYVVDLNVNHLFDFNDKIFHFLVATYWGIDKLEVMKNFYESNLKSKKKYKRALIGGGGHTREVLAQMNTNLPIFVDDEYYESKKGYYRLSDLDYDKYEVMVCVGDSKLRKKLVEKLPSNTRFFSYIHPTVLILGEDVEIGEGSFIGAYSILTTNIKVGKHCLMNRSCHIGHDCIVGDYLSMMPGSIISGNVTIGDNVYLGTNSAIKEKTKLCDDLVIGMGGVVVNDIDIQGTYIGLPVKKVE